MRVNSGWACRLLSSPPKQPHHALCPRTSYPVHDRDVATSQPNIPPDNEMIYINNRSDAELLAQLPLRSASAAAKPRPPNLASLTA